MTPFGQFGTDLLLLSLKGAAVALVVALALGLARRLRVEIPAVVRHALWLVVFVRLAVPVLPPSPLSVLSWSAAPLEQAAGVLLPGLAPDLPALGPTASAEPAVATWRDTLPAAATGLWALGLVVLLGRGLGMEIRLRHRLRRSEPVDDPRVLAILDDARRTMGIGATIAVVETPHLASPALHGTLRPRILLPADTRLGDRDLFHAFCHELAHVRRRDALTRLAARLVAAVHWFDPVAWWALRRLDEECELATDALVLARLAAPERRRYGRTLLAAATLDSRRSDRRRLPPAATALPLSTHRTLKRRIQMIARFQTPSLRRLAVVGLAALALAVVALTDAPVRAETPPPTEPAAPQSLATESEETLTAIRNSGTVLMSWHTDAYLENPPPETAQTESSPQDRVDPTEYDWNDCVPISHEELVEMVEGIYIAEMPRHDAWGHELEFCLAVDDIHRDGMIAGIRSPGRDGVFDDAPYVPGPYPTSELDRDIVWINGFFITWPQAGD